MGPDGDVCAVHALDLEVHPGQIVGLLGPNGAGKTTTLRMLATLLRPSSGDAWIAGAHCAREPERVRRMIGFQTGSTGVYERLTPEEMIALFGRLHGMDREQIRERTAQLIEQFQMRDFRDRLCGRLSTGQKQKVSIARTVVHDPPVLIFDEPLTGLDVMVGRTVIEFVKKCRDQGKALIVSTHRLPLAESLCDVVAIIYGGRRLAYGPTRELIAASGERSLEEAFFAYTQAADQAADPHHARSAS
jgi:sodium transport system ATP-binding protein